MQRKLLWLRQWNHKRLHRLRRRLLQMAEPRLNPGHLRQLLPAGVLHEHHITIVRVMRLEMLELPELDPMRGLQPRVLPAKFSVRRNVQRCELRECLGWSVLALLRVLQQLRELKLDDLLDLQFGVPVLELE